MNSKFNIQRTPGEIPGAYVSIENEITNIIRQEQPTEKKIYVKFSGDGAKMGRVKNFIIFSISFPESSNPLNQTTIGIINCTETYDCLKIACDPIFKELNELNSKRKITVDSVEYDLEFFLGGDMKFISLILGLCGATGVFACPWCKVSKESRGDTSKSYDFYNSEQMARTLAEINSCASKKLYGVKNLPLINIELCHVIPDKLHMLMRIFDVLLRNLIDDAKDKDDIAKLKKETGDYLETLVEKIRSCGVTFNIW